MRKKMAMVGWFDPVQLVHTAIRVLLSTVFGQFADRREAFAAANPIKDDKLDQRADYASQYPDGDFWFDYVADTGDGWNPTYAIARLLARDELHPRATEGGEPLPTALKRGRVLIMGGDEVYPTASPEEYDNRLLYPFDEACRSDGRWEEKQRPDLYVMPGNHDWYDGLRTFVHLFCRRTIKADGEAEVDRNGGVIGGRRTHQTRSYFALKLPRGWWLWGTDSQLEGYIDQPQVDFFQFVAQSWMEPGSKLILCTGTPDWEYVRTDKPQKYGTLSYLERLAPAVRGKNHRLKLVLSGDSHHYARFQEAGLNYITCGGGGAFLHPTHHLPTEPIKFKTTYPKPGEPYLPKPEGYDREFSIAAKAGTNQEALYPDRRTSAELVSGNVLFALRNWKLTATLASTYLFFTWLLDFNARVSGERSLVDVLAAGSLGDAVREYWLLVAYSPWTVLLCIVAATAYYYFAAVDKKWLRLLVGIVHASLQAAVVTLVTCAAIQWIAPAPPGIADLATIILSLIAAALLSALASATLIGLYLWFCLSALGLHWAHFSSLAVQGYKSFLRLRIDRDGNLHLYPVGLTKVPSDRRRRSGPPPELDPHLIETLPAIS